MLKHIEIAELLRDRLLSSSQWLVAAAAGDAYALPLFHLQGATKQVSSYGLDAKESKDCF